LLKPKLTVKTNNTNKQYIMHYSGYFKQEGLFSFISLSIAELTATCHGELQNSTK